MTAQVTVLAPVDASPDVVLDTLARRHADATRTDGKVVWTDRSGVVDEVRVTAGGDTDTRDALVLVGSFEQHVPYFGWLFDPLFRRDVRRRLAHEVRAAEADARGSAVPAAPAVPAWAPPARFSSAEVRMMGTLCFVLALTSFGGSLFTQTVDFVARSFHADDAQLGLATAVTRVGTLVALVGSAAADRFGRRRILLWATAAVIAATLLSGLAPDLATFTALQVLVRGALNLATVVAIIAVTEEAPERARAYVIGLAGLASSLGFAMGAVLLPVADLAPWAWRGLFALGGLGLLALPGIRRELTETQRYLRLVDRGVARGRVREVVDRTYGGRFLVLVAVGFLLNFFFAPSSQFTNRYLAEQRGFSGFDILVLRAVTQTVLAVLAVWAGGKIAESHGRKPASTLGVLVLALSGAAFFLTGGPLLWGMLALTTAATGFAGPSLAAFNTELFPTEVRGTAGAGLLVSAVAGSAVGLVLAGYLAAPLGGIGQGVAVTAVGPLLVGLLLIRRLPETRGLLLDEVSPPEA